MWLRVIKSFPNGSAGGPDGLRPQHLKDKTNSSNVEASSLLTALASFSTLVLEGKTPPAIHPFLFGATLVALDKKGGWVRPNAIGCTLRRLVVAKIAGAKVVNNASNLLTPRQLGYGISGGAEAAVHATRLYLNQLQPDHALIKLDFRNAFNPVRRDKMLRAVQDLVPSIYVSFCPLSVLLTILTFRVKAADITGYLASNTHFHSKFQRLHYTITSSHHVLISA